METRGGRGGPEQRLAGPATVIPSKQGSPTLPTPFMLPLARLPIREIYHRICTPREKRTDRKMFADIMLFLQKDFIY